MARAHSHAFVEAVLRAVPEQGYRRVDADTILSPGSGPAIADAAGAVITAASIAVAAGTATKCLLCRTPARSSCRIGPCHGILPREQCSCRRASCPCRAQVSPGSRWSISDVHHGNGTQDIFWNDPEAFYAAALHPPVSPIYPGTGATWREQGAHANVVNVPIRPGGGGDLFRAGFRDEILPALAVFKPDFILVSAGFDAHKDDPLADLRLTETDFAWATARFGESLARKTCVAAVWCRCWKAATT